MRRLAPLCCLVIVFWMVPLFAQGAELTEDPPTLHRGLSLGLWLNGIIPELGLPIQGQIGGTLGYELNPPWGASFSHRSGAHYSMQALPASPYDYSHEGERLFWENKGFDLLELRRKFYSNDTWLPLDQSEYYLSLGVLKFYGETSRYTRTGKKIYINDKLYENSNLSIETNQAPFQSATLGAGLNVLTDSPLFISVGLFYPVKQPTPAYRVSSTDPKVAQSDMDQEVRKQWGYYKTKPMGLNFMIGAIYAF